MLYVLNIGEKDAGRLHELEEEYRRRPAGRTQDTAVTAICGKSKLLAELPPEEAKNTWPATG